MLYPKHFHTRFHAAVMNKSVGRAVAVKKNLVGAGLVLSLE